MEGRRGNDLIEKERVTKVSMHDTCFGEVSFFFFLVRWKKLKNDYQRGDMQASEMDNPAIGFRDPGQVASLFERLVIYSIIRMRFP